MFQHDEVDGIDQREEMLLRLDVEVEINEGWECGADARIEASEEVQIPPEEVHIIEEVKGILTLAEGENYIMCKRGDRKK